MRVHRVHASAERVSRRSQPRLDAREYRVDARILDVPHRRAELVHRGRDRVRDFSREASGHSRGVVLHRLHRRPDDRALRRGEGARHVLPRGDDDTLRRGERFVGELPHLLARQPDTRGRHIYVTDGWEPARRADRLRASDGSTRKFVRRVSDSALRALNADDDSLADVLAVVCEHLRRRRDAQRLLERAADPAGQQVEEE